MSVLSDRLDALCAERGITGYRLCKDVGVSPNLMTELRSDRRNGLSAKTANKIADYFNVSVGYLLGTEDKEKPAEAHSGLGELSEEELDYISWFRERATEKEKEIVRLIISGENNEK